MSVLSALGWLLTYALHSTLLLLGGWVLARVVRDEAWRSAIWKTALVGGILTASVPAVLGYRPLVGEWHAGEAMRLERPMPASVPAGAGSGGEIDGPAPPSARPDADEGAPAEGGEEVEQATTGVEPAGTAATVATPLALALVVGWLSASLLLLVRLWLVHVRFFRSIRDRSPITDGPLAETLAGLRRRTGYWETVRLSESAACPTPVAIGTREICLPPRFATDLDAEQQRGALAHELAHLRRGDPVWQLGAGVIEVLFFFQPLNRLARRRLRESAEYLADESAAAATGSATGLARCLADIATWVGGVPVPRPSVAMAEGGSSLLARIRRLADPPHRAPIGGWWPAVVGLGAVGCVAAVAPVVSSTDDAMTVGAVDGHCALAAVDTTTMTAEGVGLVDLDIPVGDVRVTGADDRADVRVVARRCASRDELFEALRLDIEPRDSVLAMGFELPTHLFSRRQGSIARIDVEIEAPSRLAVRLRSSMGEALLSNLATVHVQKLGGDVRVDRLAGDATFDVNLGAIVAEDVRGDVVVTPQHTGDVTVRRAGANVTIGEGQAGNVHLDGVEGDALVGRIVEGTLRAENVAGRVLR